MAIDRREFIKLGGIGVAGVTFLPLLQACEEHSIDTLRPPEAAPFLTPNSRFFEQNGGKGSIDGWTRPSFGAPTDWSLAIKQGNTTLDTVTWDRLMDAAEEESITILKTIECVLQSPVRLSSTGFAGNAYWTGVPLRRFLDEAGLDYGPSSSVKRLLLTGADGFFNNIKPERILQSEAMGLVQPLLVFEMNGSPLDPEHGFPVRLIIQEGFGYKNVKWITEVQSINFDDDFGTYQEQGFVDDGIIRVNSRSTSLFDSIDIPSGPVMITGFALSGFAPIDRVEVSIDGGTPQQAEIVSLEEIQQEASLPPTIDQLSQQLPYPYRAVWTPWRFEWDAPGGEHNVAIRAVDADGNMQPDVDPNHLDGQNEVTRYTVNVS